MPRMQDERGKYRAMTPQEVRAAFEASIMPVTESGCWLWTGNCTKHGYGVMRGRYMHRYSHEIHKGDPGQLHVMHSCDVPSCVNPAHLSLGTAADNHADKNRKGRASGGSFKGEAHKMHKLTAADVGDIRTEYQSRTVTQWELARRYGVSQGTISSIVLGRTWR